MYSLLVVLIFSAFIGYFAQITGLCMVSGVADWVKGRPVRLLAILSTGFWVYLYLPLIEPGNIPLHLQRYELHWGFLLRTNRRQKLLSGQSLEVACRRA